MIKLNVTIILTIERVVIVCCIDVVRVDLGDFVVLSLLALVLLLLALLVFLMVWMLT